jgi:hypothetical protein
VKILFSTSSFGFLRNFQSTVRRLADAGHEVVLVAERGDTIDGQKMAETLAGEYGRIRIDSLPSSRYSFWSALGTGLRASLDYWRYLDPRWDDAPKLRARAASQAPPLARAAARLPIIGSRPGLACLQRLFRACDHALPPPRELTAALERHAPDVLLLTPLLYFRSYQVEQVRSARALGIPTMLGVGSWDHLTTKGLIHEVPDRILVWNEPQRREAVELHGVPADRVGVTGAQAYDHWFAARPSSDRATFCRRVGLDAQRPVLLYLCSSPFIAPYEVGFVRRWMSSIRNSADPRLRSAGLLVRPHPQNAKQWEDVDLSAEFENAAIWPRAGVNPIGGEARADYFDSMYHAEAVVGVNTSAMIESGIVGRPVYSVADAEFAATQEGTLHFQHLKNVEGGLLHLAAGFDDHVRQLEQLFADGSAERQSARQFIKGFIRPHGLNVPATPRVAAEIEELAAGAERAPAVAPLSLRVLRLALVPAAIAAMFATADPVKLRAIVRHWTRPARLAGRALWSRLIYAARFLRRLPHRALRLAIAAVRLLTVRPVLWLLHRGKLALQAFLVWRKQEVTEKTEDTAPHGDTESRRRTHGERIVANDRG